MSAPTPKNDQRAALRLAQFESREALRHQQAKQPVKPVTLAKIEEKLAVAREAVNNEVSKNAVAQAKWRKSHPDVSRERVRVAMRKKRAKAKTQ